MFFLWYLDWPRILRRIAITLLIITATLAIPYILLRLFFWSITPRCKYTPADLLARPEYHLTYPGAIIQQQYAPYCQNQTLHGAYIEGRGHFTSADAPPIVEAYFERELPMQGWVRTSGFSAGYDIYQVWRKGNIEVELILYDTESRAITPTPVTPSNRYAYGLTFYLGRKSTP